MARLALYTIVIALKLLSAASNPVIIASSPNLMRVGNHETVLVSLHDVVDPVDVTVKLKLNENGDEGLISESVVTVGEVALCAVLYVDPERIPSVETEEELQRYAYITVSCDDLDFEETKQVLLSYEEGFVFIQTDKPVYTPSQSVKIRVVSLDQDLTPSSQEVQVDIVTPQDVIIQRKSFEENKIVNGILQFTFEFDQDPLFGHWKIVARYGKDLTVNRTVQFEVKEYVLPTFSVKIVPPYYVLPTDEIVTIRVSSRYVYGKNVRGRCFFKVGVQEEGEEPVIYHSVGEELDAAGDAEIVMETSNLGENWFEENVGKSLYVEATVVEDATGHIENASDTSAKFVESPFMFTWERTIRYFKKGLPYEVKTDLKFMNGKPAPGVRVKVIAAASIEGRNDEMILRGADRNPVGEDEGNPQNVGNELEPTEDDTNEKGQVNFRLYVPRQCTNIRISLETVVPELQPTEDNPSDNNARLQFNITPFESPHGNEYLVLRVTDQEIRPQFGDLLVDVFLNSVTAAPVVSYFVVARGKLMAYGKRAVANVDGFEIEVSYEMVPSARIVAYYISDNGDIISDSIWIEIKRECENSLRVSPHKFRPQTGFVEESAIGDSHIHPQSQISLRVRGTPGTSVALLAVDQAVLLLRDYHRLTPDKMYGSMDEHDTGCGPGGGRNPADVFMNAGLMVLTNLNLDVPHREGNVGERKRRFKGEKFYLPILRKLCGEDRITVTGTNGNITESATVLEVDPFRRMVKVQVGEEEREIHGSDIFVEKIEDAPLPRKSKKGQQRNPHKSRHSAEISGRRVTSKAASSQTVDDKSSTGNNYQERGPICAVSTENNRRKRSLDAPRLRSLNADIQHNLEEYACRRGTRRLGEGTCDEKAVRFENPARDKLRQVLSGEYQGLNRRERRQLIDELIEELKAIFVECCMEAESNANLRSGGIDLTDPKFISTKPSEVQIRNDFRESWAFDIIEIPEEPHAGTVDQIYSVPGSITTWSLQAFGLHRDQAMCVQKEVDLKVFMDLFIQLHLPYSIVRKEAVEIQATVFNYGLEDIAVRMFLEVPDEICSEGIPGELSAEKNFVVAAHDARTITYMLVGLETGEFPIKVAALTPGMSDVVVKTLKVVPEGVMKTFQHSTILNPGGARVEASRLNQQQDENFVECGGIPMGNDGTQRNCLEITLPPSAVPDSASCFVSVTGNAMGPILTTVISGLESLIHLPSGCGEQNMIKLAPNVYVLRYLTNTESGTDADKAKALTHSQSGITSQMRFRVADGSFTVWPGYASSTWLTAFVAKVFCQATEFFHVDPTVTCDAIRWLLRQVQRPNDGAFFEPYRVHHREMTGGVQGDAALTAFVLIAMSECQCESEVPELETSVLHATQFLEDQLNTLQRPYVIAIVTYALALTGSERRFDANNKLKLIAIYDNGKGTRFWGTDASSLHPGSRPYWYQRRPSAISVETTSYALLAQLALGEISYSHSIVKWLSEQQNYEGGFVSTQDTVIALQALSEYATLNSGSNLDMYCNVTGPENFKTVLRLQEGDALVQKTQEVPSKSISGKLMVKTAGEGIGQLNVAVTYNDLKAMNDEDCPFNLEVESHRVDGEEGTPYRKDDKIRIRVCASYLGGERTGMSILDVGLYSGFKPVTESLKNLVGGDSPINRTEVSGRSVILYADHIPVQQEPPLCVEFEALCEIVVGNLQHAAVHVYDYYNPAEECRKFYAPAGTNLLGTLCSNEGMCSCVSSKCAACSAPQGERTQDLLRIACDTAETYVYKIVVTDIETDGGFDVISARVERVIKRGDDHEIFENADRKFWVSSSCECPGMRRGRKYMVIGRNYLQYDDRDGLPGFKYIIDNAATVRAWRKGRRFAYLDQVQEEIENGRSNCG